MFFELCNFSLFSKQKEWQAKFCVIITYINGWSMKIIEGDCYRLNSEDEIEKSQGAN